MTSIVQLPRNDAVNSKSASRRTDAGASFNKHPSHPPDWGKTSHPPASDGSKKHGQREQHRCLLFDRDVKPKKMSVGLCHRIFPSFVCPWAARGHYKVMRILNPVKRWNASPGTCLTSSDRRVASSRPAVTLRVSEWVEMMLHCLKCKQEPDVWWCCWIVLRLKRGLWKQSST